jgi:hypothetical protein
MDFEEWAAAFGKQPLPESRAVFEANVAMIEAHNSANDRG